MTNHLFDCEVLTPEGRVFSGKVSQVVLPAWDGQMGVLVGHAPMVCELGFGEARMRLENGVEETRFIEGGFVHIRPDSTVLLTQAAVPLDQVTRESAEKLLEQAKEIEVTSEVAARRKAELEANAHARLRIAVK